MTYEKACEYIYSIPKFTKKNGLEHTKKLLKRMGNPQNRFEVIHVAGSNGKGSVCAFINSVLCVAKKPTGLFVSPHLICMEERFVVNGKNCTQEDFLESFSQVKKVVDQMQEEGLAHPAFFEFLFAMGMEIFAKNKVQYVILETGLGGRLDATNIFVEPLMTIITSISLEHTEILGDTIAKIASEKEGIIKEGIPVIYDGGNEEASEVIVSYARKKRAPYYEINLENLKIHKITGNHIDFSIHSSYDDFNLVIPFAAEYQMMNAALAYKALELLRIEIGYNPVDIYIGMGQVRWPGRMQEVVPDVYFDGAHNTAGIAVFLRTVIRISNEKPILLFSMVKEKNYVLVIQAL